ncbi:MAG: alpha/beta fold hydrolase, partial [Aliifodinibius sp.]|nr:alpha/beta fold hydrolase [Fodinibius sp.]
MTIAPVVENHITIKAEDNFPLAATTFTAEQTSSKKTIVLGSALGVPRYIYFKLATFFAEHHFNVLCFDYRGIYESKKSNISGSEIRMYDWGNRDINAALEWSIENWASDKLIYIGHSCGGQLVGLANHASKIDAAIFIASQSGYWKLWPFPHKLVVWSVWQLIPLITPCFD